MNPIVVEHVFVTTLPSAQVLPQLGEALRSRGFARDGNQQLDPMRPDWTVFQFRRGSAAAARARNLADYSQDVRIEWDRQRITLALSIDPASAGAGIRGQLTELLLLRAGLLEDLATGYRPARDVLYEWAHAEQPLLLLSGTSQAGATSSGGNPFFRSYWGWICIGLCILMAITAGTLPGYSATFRVVVAAIGIACAMGCVALGFLPVAAQPNRTKTHAWTIAISCWVGLFIAAVFAKSFAHMGPDSPSDNPTEAVDDSGNPQPGPQNQPGAPPRQNFPMPQPPHAQTLDGAIADLASTDGFVRGNAADWMAKLPANSPDGPRILAALKPFITAEDPGERDHFLRVFCRFATAANTPELVKCLSYPERYAGCWHQALEVLLRTDPATAAKAARAQLGNRRFEDDVTSNLERIADSESPTKANARKIVDSLNVELRLARLKNGERIGGKITSMDEALAAMSADIPDVQILGVKYVEDATLTPVQIPKAKELLRKLLASDNREVLYHATKTFIKYADKNDAPDLTKLAYAGSDRGYIQGPALSGLLLVDPAAGRKILEEDPRNGMLRIGVFSDLAKAGPRAEPAYIELLKCDEIIQKEAVSGLAQVGTAKAIAPLQALASTLGDDNRSRSTKVRIQNIITAIQSRPKTP